MTNKKRLKEKEKEAEEACSEIGRSASFAREQDKVHTPIKAPIPGKIFCAKCGAKAPADSTYCPKCGTLMI